MTKTISKKPIHYILLSTIQLIMMSSCDMNSIETDPLISCAYNLEIVSGNNQAATPNDLLKDSIVFRITDSENQPVPDMIASCKVVIGNGSLDANQKKTDINGCFCVNWRVGSGIDQIMKAEVTDTKGITGSVWAVANSDVEFTTKWKSNIVFYRNFTESFEHDNRILETDNLLIFSNAATDDNKAIFAKIGEEHFQNIIQWLDINQGDLGIISSDYKTKIKIYAHTSTNQTGLWRGAKNSGIIFPAYGYGVWSRKVLAHEIAHMVELLLIIPENFVGIEIPTWFTEGIADFFADFPSAYPWPIDNVSRLDDWFSKYKNPISIVKDEDMGSTVPTTYYTMFGLVFKYLLDPGGHNVSPAQIRTFYQDLIRTRDFNQSFQQKIGMSISELQASIYDWLRDYLSNI